MARIRTIKPSFFRSEDVSALPLRARLTWIGLWTQCDDQGRTKDNTKLIKADVWPLDQVSLADIEEDLVTLAFHGRIARYEVDGRRFLEVVNWDDHQTINRPSKSKIPPPTAVAGNGSKPASTATSGTSRAPRPTAVTEKHGTTPGTLTELPVSTHAGKGKEGKGKEGNARAREDEPSTPHPPDSEPPSRCEKHLSTADPPRCGGCADARKLHNRWTVERSKRVANAPKCPMHRGELADNCAICRSEELSPA